MNKSNEKVVKIEKGIEAITIPEDFLREMGLVPGSDVELFMDKQKKWVVMRPLSGDDNFIKHFSDAMDQLA